MKLVTLALRGLGCLLLLLPLTALAATPIFVNELHYDNAGTDTSEAVEIAGPVGTDLSGWSVVLYNGSNGNMYATANLSGTIPANCSGMGDGVVALSPGPIQNGAPDGLALVDANGQVVQFLSYEGSFSASNGPAAGLTSTDIGVAETNGTPAGQSLQLTGSGSNYEDFTWSEPSNSSMASCNAGQTFAAAQTPSVQPFVNELHYDNAGSDSNEGVEIAGSAGTSLDGWSLLLYNGSNGEVYATTALSGSIPANCTGTGAGVVTVTPGAIQNGGPDGLALVDAAGEVIQFLSYEGSFAATDGPAAGMTSSDIGVAENGNTPSGDSLQLTGSGSAYGDFTWTGPATASFGACNAGQHIAAGGGAGGGGDVPPSVVATTPADGSASFPADANLAIQFSAPVDLDASWYTLICDTSGSHDAAAQSGSGAAYSLDPATDFTPLEACTLTIDATKVHAEEGSADAMAADVVVHFSVADTVGGDYYQGADTSNGPALHAWLHTRLTTAPSPYTSIKSYPYSGSGTNTWVILNQADQDPNNPANILDLYHNLSLAKISGGQGAYNREHTWPKSLGFPDASLNGKPNPPYTDAHMLHLADTTYNGQRGNGLLGDCPSGVTCTALWTAANDGYGGDQNNHGDANWKDGDTLFEVWDHRKGDVARAVMYMAVRYDGGVDADGICEPDLKLTDNASLVQVMNAQTASGCSGSANVAYNGLLTDLLQWNEQDPPDNQERLRNDVVFSYQHNRNPFIDHPEWAECVFKNQDCPASPAASKAAKQ